MAYSQGGGKKKVCYYYDGEQGRRGSARAGAGGRPSNGRPGRAVSPVPAGTAVPAPRDEIPFLPGRLGSALWRAGVPAASTCAAGPRSRRRLR